MSKLSPIRNEILSPASGRAASQATTVEQSRAIAEVQAAVVVAQQCPRSEASAMTAAMQTCGMKEVAERAFFKFPRGGQTLSGPSIHLAVELARVWGNVKYGLRELSRDDDAARSEMLAYAWDVQTNTRAETTFISPHMRDKKGGPEVLTDLRDIYESNANAGARRLREMIFRVLPPYLVEQAKAKCMETLQKGDGKKPLPARRADTIAAFEKIGVSRGRLEAKAGNADTWTEVDIANLGVSYQSIKRGEIAATEEFPEYAAEAVMAELSNKPSPQAPAAEEAEKGADAAGATTDTWEADRLADIAACDSLGTLAEMQQGWKAAYEVRGTPTETQQRLNAAFIERQRALHGARR